MGSGGKSVGYLAHGTATDYMFDVAGVPLSFTWEIFGDPKANFADCFKMFHPVDEATLAATVANWAAAVLTLVQLLPHHPDIAAMKFTPLIKVAATSFNKTVVHADTSSGSKAKDGSSDSNVRKDMRIDDEAVHGGRNDALLQLAAVEIHDSALQDHDLDGPVHENVFGGHMLHPSDMPAASTWLYLLPVLILLLLVFILRRARTDRIPWLRMRQRMV